MQDLLDIIYNYMHACTCTKVLQHSLCSNYCLIVKLNARAFYEKKTKIRARATNTK